MLCTALSAVCLTSRGSQVRFLLRPPIGARLPCGNAGHTKHQGLSTALRDLIIWSVDSESEALVDGFALSLRSENKATRTVET
jgi:hypothetical protein